MHLLCAFASDLPLHLTWQGELQLLCMQLDRHISTHIRESPEAMHRTRLKDLATQTYVRWQELLACCQPKVPCSPSPGLGGVRSGKAAWDQQRASAASNSCCAPGQDWVVRAVGDGGKAWGVLGIFSQNPVRGGAGDGDSCSLGLASHSGGTLQAALLPFDFWIFSIPHIFTVPLSDNS